MSRTVLCRKYQQQLEGLDAAPYPGAKGQDIFDHISKKAWLEWQAHQTRLINELELNMVDPDSRRFLKEEMDKFIAGEEYAQADGFVPENK
jgi:Fe-S cluster biosynthesis and repair protein YggX